MERMVWHQSMSCSLTFVLRAVLYFCVQETKDVCFHPFWLQPPWEYEVIPVSFIHWNKCLLSLCCVQHTPLIWGFKREQGRQCLPLWSLWFKGEARYYSSSPGNTKFAKDSDTWSHWERESNPFRDRKTDSRKFWVTSLENWIDQDLTQIFGLLYPMLCPNVGKSGPIYVNLIDRLY